MPKELKKFLAYTLVVAAIAVCVLSVVFYGEGAISIITSITTLLGIYAIFIEVKRGKAIKHAQFLIYLNDFWMKDESNIKISNKLNAFIDNKGEQLLTEADRSDLIDQLVYFESIAPSILRGLISLKKVDDMLSYRFFRIVNNPIVQKWEIIPEAEYYRGIIKLHKMWTNFKKDYGLPILIGEHSLEKNFPDYEKYAN